MSHREVTAGVQLVGQVLAGLWLVYEALTGGFGGVTVMGAAIKLLWVIGGVLVFTTVATIVVTIVVSVARGEEFVDEPADERDLLIEARSLKYAGMVTSSVAALALLPLAFGADASLAVYALFGAPMLGGTVNAAMQLFYYRTN